MHWFNVTVLITNKQKICQGYKRRQTQKLLWKRSLKLSVSCLLISFSGATVESTLGRISSSHSFVWTRLAMRIWWGKHIWRPWVIRGQLELLESGRKEDWRGTKTFCWQSEGSWNIVMRNEIFTAARHSDMKGTNWFQLVWWLLLEPL